MLNGTFDNGRHALDAWNDLTSTGDESYDSERLAEVGTVLAESLRALLDELVQPTNLQALALARLMRDRPNAQVVVHQNVFDLPDGYWLAIIGVDGFQCGIAPDGSVSS